MRQPCDERAITELVGLYESAYHLSDAVPHLNAFAASCDVSSSFLDLEIEVGTKVSDFGFTLAGVDVVVVDDAPDGLDGTMGADLLSRITLSRVKGQDWKVEAR